MVPNSSFAAPAVPAAHPAWITRLPKPLVTRSSGPLAGWRFAAKDNIDVAGVPTTAACPAFAYLPSQHATVVQRLLDAGAQLLGKTNLDQFACGLNGTRSPYGAVPNAINPAYVCGGSSSGSAWVVAKGEADFSLGTDTAGSGRVPAGLNNIVGLKPSRGLISTHGVLPAAQSVDCVSIFTRTVPQAVQVLHAAMGFDPQDAGSRRIALARHPFPARLRVGVPAYRSFFGDALAEAAFKDALKRLRTLGAETVDVDFGPLSEAASLLYDSALVAERHAAIRAFFDAHEDRVIEPVRGIIASGRQYAATDVFEAQARLRALAQRVAPMWERIDVLLVPTAPTHYTLAQMQADPVTLNRNLGAYTNFVNLLDYAALSVPSSLRPDGLPFGVTFIGPCGSDLQLAELGQRFHLATGLTQGATGEPLGAAQPIAGLNVPRGVTVAVVGAHLSGMPLNGQLTERGATLIGTATTAPDYRFFALPGTVPPKPGLLRVAPGTGGQIALELWDMPIEHYGSFVTLVAPPQSIGTLTLADGRAVQGFLCEALATEGARDITHLGGWRAYIASLAPPR